MDTDNSEVSDDGFAIVDESTWGTMDEEVVEEEWQEEYEDVSGETTDIDMEAEEIAVEEITEEIDTSALTEEQMSLFAQAQEFCRGEYEGDADALYMAMGEDAYASVMLDSENAQILSKEVQKIYLKVLTDGTGSYQADGTEMYLTTELNMLSKSLKDVFGLTEGVQANPELSELSDGDRTVLYQDTMKFFEKLYGESSEYETMDTEDAENAEYDGEAELAE